MSDAIISAMSSGWGIFGTAFFFSSLLLLFLTRVRAQKVRVEAGRTSTHSLSYRLGGVALILSFWLAWWIDGRVALSPGLMALLWGSILILLVGVRDDYRPIPWWGQLIFQGLLGLLLLSAHLSIDIMQGPLGGTIDFRTWFASMPSIILFVWLLLILNALNWVDGHDGLLSIVTLIGFLTLFVVSVFPEVKQPAISLLALAFSGTLLALLLFNWPPARILAGTSGAYFLGFSLVTLSVMAGAKVATTLLVLTVPVIDALYVIWERWRSHQPVFEPDRRHLHHRLKELGFSPSSIILLYGTLTLAMAILALSVEGWGKMFVFVFGGVGVLILCVTTARRFHTKFH